MDVQEQVVKTLDHTFMQVFESSICLMELNTRILDEELTFR